MNMEQYWRAYDKSLEPPDEPPTLAECGNCGQEFTEGEQVLTHDNDYYCDEKCMADSLGGYWTYLEED